MVSAPASQPKSPSSPRLLVQALRRDNPGRPPVWMMRQAGRYHRHYQNLRRRHSFEELCKNPDLAAEVAMGPVDDFGFDAAILFSDILFPIEQMGIPLKIDPSPRYGRYLDTVDALTHYTPPANADGLSFQYEALCRTRARLSDDTALIGFVGGALTLYFFAVCGSRKKDVTPAHTGLSDGRFHGFMEKIVPLLADNILLQAAARPDCLAIFESCAGELSAAQFHTLYLPYLADILNRVRAKEPTLPILYYAKDTDAAYWPSIATLPVQALGVDHHTRLTDVLQTQSARFAVQGNLDPHALTLPHEEFKAVLAQYLDTIKRTTTATQRTAWICGLGHGVTPQAHEDNVRHFVNEVKKF